MGLLYYPSFAAHQRDFYSGCEECGRSGHDPIEPDHEADPQCLACLPVRRRVAQEEAAWILEKRMVELGRMADRFAR